MKFLWPVLVGVSALLCNSVMSAEFLPLSDAESAAASANYQQYCALCHGANRQGHANDHAPSLNSRSLMESGFLYPIMYAMSYGRRGTAMAGFLDEVGGPLTEEDIFVLTRWLQEQGGFEPVELSSEPISGDIALGKKIYVEECADCHGTDGEGDIGTALGNPVMLSLSSDAFVRYAIENGRQQTDMPEFGGYLEAGEMDAVTAFIRSRASGWSVQKPVFRSPPTTDHYVMNPDSPDPEFELQDEAYVLAKDLFKAIQDKRKLVLLDTRATSQWQMVHIEGAVPIPYYYEGFDALVPHLPADGTWIVAYCECPRAAAETVYLKLQERGFKNIAVLWEGIQGWVSLGYPVSQGELMTVEVDQLQQ